MTAIVFNPKAKEISLRSQIENFQTTLASLNQQIISLRETLHERDKQVIDLQTKLASQGPTLQTDQTLTIMALLIKLYKYIFLPERWNKV